jgi:hypothetical protein
MCVCKVNIKNIHGSAPNLPCPSIFGTFSHALTYSSTLKMEAASSSEILTVVYWTTWCHILQGSNLNKSVDLSVYAFQCDKYCYIKPIGTAVISVLLFMGAWLEFWPGYQLSSLGFTWFSSVPPGKCQSRPLPLPSKSFKIHHSEPSTIWCYIVEILTV